MTEPTKPTDQQVKRFIATFPDPSDDLQLPEDTVTLPRFDPVDTVTYYRDLTEEEVMENLMKLGLFDISTHKITITNKGLKSVNGIGTLVYDLEIIRTQAMFQLE